VANALAIITSGAFGFIEGLDGFVLFESVGLFTKFPLAQRTVMNLRRRDIYIATAPQRNGW